MSNAGKDMLMHLCKLRCEDDKAKLMNSSTLFHSHDIPKLPQFTGDELKGKISYQQWEIEVSCLQIDDKVSQRDGSSLEL